MYALPNTVQPCASPISSKSQQVEQCDRECSSVFKLGSVLLDDRSKSHFTHICQLVQQMGHAEKLFSFWLFRCLISVGSVLREWKSGDSLSERTRPLVRIEG